MQVDLYQTLKSINVTDDQAKLVVASIEEYIDDMVGDATKPLQEKIDGLQRSLETHMKTQTGHQHHRLYHRGPDRDRNAGVDPAALTSRGLRPPFFAHRQFLTINSTPS